MKNSGEAWDVKHAKNLDFSRKNGIFRAPEKVGENELSPLLSGRSEVQILLATPKTPPKTLIFQGFRRFLFSKKNRTHNKQRLAGSIFANQTASPDNLPKNHAKNLANRMGECYRVKGIFLKFISYFCRFPYNDAVRRCIV